MRAEGETKAQIKIQAEQSGIYSLGAQARAEHFTCITVFPTQSNLMIDMHY